MADLGFGRPFPSRGFQSTNESQGTSQAGRPGAGMGPSPATTFWPGHPSSVSAAPASGWENMDGPAAQYMLFQQTYPGPQPQQGHDAQRGYPPPPMQWHPPPPMQWHPPPQMQWHPPPQMQRYPAQQPQHDTGLQGRYGHQAVQPYLTPQYNDPSPTLAHAGGQVREVPIDLHSLPAPSSRLDLAEVISKLGLTGPAEPPDLGGVTCNGVAFKVPDFLHNAFQAALNTPACGDLPAQHFIDRLAASSSGDDTFPSFIVGGAIRDVVMMLANDTLFQEAADKRLSEGEALDPAITYALHADSFGKALEINPKVITLFMKDIDLITPAKLEEIEARFSDLKDKLQPRADGTRRRYGNLTFKGPEDAEGVDIAVIKEKAGRPPGRGRDGQHVAGTDLTKDAMFRDFRCNTLIYDAAKKLLIDPLANRLEPGRCSGLVDAANQTLSVLGGNEADLPWLALRAVKFLVRGFHCEMETEDAPSTLQMLRGALAEHLSQTSGGIDSLGLKAGRICKIGQADKDGALREDLDQVREWVRGPFANGLRGLGIPSLESLLGSDGRSLTENDWVYRIALAHIGNAPEKWERADLAKNERAAFLTFAVGTRVHENRQERLAFIKAVSRQVNSPRLESFRLLAPLLKLWVQRISAEGDASSSQGLQYLDGFFDGIRAGRLAAAEDAHKAFVQAEAPGLGTEDKAFLKREVKTSVRIHGPRDPALLRDLFDWIVNIRDYNTRAECVQRFLSKLSQHAPQPASASELNQGGTPSRQQLTDYNHELHLVEEDIRRYDRELGQIPTQMKMFATSTDLLSEIEEKKAEIETELKRAKERKTELTTAIKDLESRSSELPEATDGSSLSASAEAPYAEFRAGQLLVGGQSVLDLNDVLPAGTMVGGPGRTATSTSVGDDDDETKSDN